ncbi:MAG TPA: T9SS type A sorting domain-containing protein [Saprospiraceae bacterium]|nr:T9SS type A sorting domain-containing protein [Saprospiraceae bacterium]
MKKKITLSLTFCILVVHMLLAQSGKLISQGYYGFDTGSGMVLIGDSSTLAYNPQLLPNEYRNFKLNTGTGFWEEKSRSTDYQYDANGNLLRFTRQNGNDLDGWVNTWRNSYTYNANNHELTDTLERWESGNWVLSSFTESEYDTNGSLISATGLSDRRLYTYNAEGLLEIETWQNKTSGNWENAGQISYVYFPNSNLMQTQLSSYWISGTWNASNRIQFQYDVNGNNTEAVTEYMVQNQWMPARRTTMEYDAEDNLIYWVSSDWNGVNWVADTRQFNTYDQNNNFTSERLEVLDSTGWQIATYGRLHYSTLSGIHKAELTSFEVFPNPATSSVRLLGENLESAQIVDQQGRVISQVSLNQHEATNIPVSQLAPGLYYIQVRDHMGDSGVKPVMIQR